MYLQIPEATKKQCFFWISWSLFTVDNEISISGSYYKYKYFFQIKYSTEIKKKW